MRWLVLLIGMALSGCVTDAGEMVYRRLDGQTMIGRPELIAQFETDRTICQGEMAKADSTSAAPPSRRLQANQDVMNGCMAQKGYRLGPK